MESTPPTASLPEPFGWHHEDKKTREKRWTRGETRGALWTAAAFERSEKLARQPEGRARRRPAKCNDDTAFARRKHFQFQNQAFAGGLLILELNQPPA
jgi:hypothetical protein